MMSVLPIRRCVMLVLPLLLPGVLGTFAQESTNVPPAFQTLPTEFGCVAPPGLSCSLQVDQSVQLAGKDNNRSVVQVTVDAPEVQAMQEELRANQPPVHVCVVLDRSGSMKGEKLAAAKEAVRQAAASLRATDRFALVTFGDQVDTVVECLPRGELTKTGELNTICERISPAGDTALFGGISRAAALLRPHLAANSIHRLLLISDGAANKGPSSTRHLLRLANSLFKENMSISTFGLGDGFQEELLAGIANKSDGNFYFVPKPDALAGAIQTEMNELFSVVAQNVMVELNCPPGVTPVQFIGREGMIDGQTAEVSMNQLNGGHQQVALLEVELDKAKPVEKRQIEANVYFRNGLTQENDVTSMSADWTFTTNRQEAKKSENAAVLAEEGNSRYAQVRWEAVNQLNQGNFREAQNILQAETTNLYNIANKANAPELYQYLDNLKALNQKVARQQNLESRERKQLLDESYRTVRQRVMVEPPRVREVHVPAKYETVTRQQLVQPKGQESALIPQQAPQLLKPIPLPVEQPPKALGF